MDLLTLLQSKHGPDDLKLDVGANEGGYTHLMLQAHPECQIHAFEPLPPLYEGLERRFADDPSVFVFHAGVSDHEFMDSGFAVFEAWTLDKPGLAVRGRNADALEKWGDRTFTIQFVTIDA